MKRKIETIIYGYDPKQFIPILRDGRLDNRREFLAYKISRLAKKQLV